MREIPEKFFRELQYISAYFLLISILLQLLSGFSLSGRLKLIDPTISGLIHKNLNLRFLLLLLSIHGVIGLRLGFLRRGWLRENFYGDLGFLTTIIFLILAILVFL